MLFAFPFQSGAARAFAERYNVSFFLFMKETNVDNESRLLQGRFGILAVVLAVQEVAIVSFFVRRHLCLIANWATGSGSIGSPHTINPTNKSVDASSKLRS